MLQFELRRAECRFLKVSGSRSGRGLAGPPPPFLPSTKVGRLTAG